MWSVSLGPRLVVQAIFFCGGGMPKWENRKGARGVWKSFQIRIDLTSGEEMKVTKEGYVGKVSRLLWSSKNISVVLVLSP